MPELRRSIGLSQATAMVVGTIIGASIFAQPSEITRLVPTGWGIVLVWLAAGVLASLGALVCAELASAFDETGGIYVFLREAYSPVLGFLWGWTSFWSIHSGIIAAIAMVFARYAAVFVPVGDVGIQAMAIGAIAATSAINYVGVETGSRVQTAFTAGKVLAILVMIAAGLLLTPAAAPGGPSAWAGADLAADVSALHVREALLGVAAGLFAFGGWHMVTYAAGETLSASRTVPLALLLGTAIVTACYVALNAVYLAILPLDALRTSTRVAADAADRLVGGGGASAMAVLVMFSTFGSITGIVLAGARLYYSMARDGLMFRWAADVHPRYRTPARAIVLQGLCASALVATGTYRTLFTRVIYLEWLFFGLMAAGVFFLRARPSYRPAFRTWGYPVAPLVFVVSSAAIVVNQLFADPAESLFGLGVVAAGLPVYAVWIRPRRVAE
ncbi:MAG: amino acid permease [Vicinamibacterales bacterium]